MAFFAQNGASLREAMAIHLGGHGAVMLLTMLILKLIYGLDKRCTATISGAALGILVMAVQGYLFTELLLIYGAVMEGSKRLFYVGYAHLDLTKIIVASIFLGSSSAVMDLSVPCMRWCRSTRRFPRVRPSPRVSPWWDAGYHGHAAAGLFSLMVVFMAQGTSEGMILVFRLAL